MASVNDTTQAAHVQQKALTPADLPEEKGSDRHSPSKISIVQDVVQFSSDATSYMGTAQYWKEVGTVLKGEALGVYEAAKGTIVGTYHLANGVVNAAADPAGTGKALARAVSNPEETYRRGKETVVNAAQNMWEGMSRPFREGDLEGMGKVTGATLFTAATAAAPFAKAGQAAGGLTTPRRYFANATKGEVEAALENKFGPPRSVRPEAKTYHHPETHRSFNVNEAPGHMGGKPHVDIRRRGQFEERKYFLKEE